MCHVLIMTSEAQQDSLAALQSARRLLLRENLTLPDANDQDMISLAFPKLFPYGRGHPRDSRPVAVSFLGCIQRYLRLSTRRHATDSKFVLAMHDLVTRFTTLRNAAIKVKLDPNFGERMKSLAVAEMEKALLRRNKNARAAMCHTWH